MSVSYSEIDAIAADLEFVEALLRGEKVPLTTELHQDIRDAWNSVRVAAEILRALPIEVVEQIPSHIQR